MVKAKREKRYYPFGMTMPGRKFIASPPVGGAGGGYRYGFNGKENDKDVSEGIQDYGMRIYDARLGRFLSVDPLKKEYPWNSTYSFAENDVIRSIDLEGAEKLIIIINRDRFGRLTSVSISGIRDKDLKDAVDLNFSRALNVDLTEEDVAIIVRRPGRAESTSFAKWNDKYEEYVKAAKTINPSLSTVSRPLNYISEGDVSLVRDEPASNLFGTNAYDSEKYEFFESTKQYRYTNRITRTPVYNGSLSIIMGESIQYNRGQMNGDIQMEYAHEIPPGFRNLNNTIAQQIRNVQNTLRNNQNVYQTTTSINVTLNLFYHQNVTQNVRNAGANNAGRQLIRYFRNLGINNINVTVNTQTGRNTNNVNVNLTTTNVIQTVTTN